MIGLIFLATIGQAQHLDIQGHRGARGLLPENTLPAFQKALELGVDTLELDLAVTKDGVLVISHDPHVNPEICTGPAGAEVAADLAIHSLTQAELAQYDCGAKANPNFESQVAVPGTQIPTLAEVLELGQGNSVRFNIETKITPEWEQAGLTPAPMEFARLAVEQVQKAGLIDRVTLQSFDFRTLTAAHELAPELELAALSDDPEFIAAAPGNLGDLPVQVFSPFFGLLDSDRVKEIQAAGYKVIPWTVNNPEDIREVLAWGVDGIISDYPDRAIEIAQELKLR